MYQEILGSERRRQWTDAQKLKIIEEIDVNGATVAEVARRHELTRQHLYQWRNHFRRKRALQEEDDIAFLPVEMKPNRRPASVKATIHLGKRLSPITKRGKFSFSTTITLSPLL